MPLISAASYSWFRVVYLSVLIVRLLAEYPLRIHEVKRSLHYNAIPSFTALGLDRLPPELFQLSYFLLLVAALIAFEGRLARWAFPVMALAGFLVWGTRLGFDRGPGTYVSHALNSNMYFLVIFAFLPARYHVPLRALIRGERGGEVSYGPALLFKLSIAIVYFGAIYTRLANGGLYWFTGFPLQGIFADRYTLLDQPLLLELASSRTLCMALAALTFFFEATFILSIFNRWTFLLYVVGAMVFHLSILQLMGINFLSFHALTYTVVLIDFLPRRKS